MTVRIPSDLVVDVMRAADPVKAQMAARKLAATSATAVAGADFEQVMTQAVAPSQEEPAAAHAKPAADPYGQFESFMLRDAFETMLPKDDASAFGEGFAGGVWRSMAADQFASIFTQHGGLGVAEMLRQRDAAPGVVPSRDGQWPYFRSAPLSAKATT